MKPATIRRNGCAVTVSQNIRGEYLLRIGMNTYGPFLTKREAIKNVSRYI